MRKRGRRELKGEGSNRRGREGRGRKK